VDESGERNSVRGQSIRLPLFPLPLLVFPFVDTGVGRGFAGCGP